VVTTIRPLLQSLMPQGYKARPSSDPVQVSAGTPTAPQHIPQKFDAADVAAALAPAIRGLPNWRELAALKPRGPGVLKQDWRVSSCRAIEDANPEISGIPGSMLRMPPDDEE